MTEDERTHRDIVDKDNDLLAEWGSEEFTGGLKSQGSRVGPSSKDKE